MPIPPNQEESVDSAISMQNEMTDAGEIWQTLRTKRRVILIAGAIGFVLAAIYSLTLHNVYTAKSSFIIPKAAASSASLLSEQLQSLTGGSSFRSQGDMYLGILTSRHVQDQLIEEFNLQSVFHAKKLSNAERRLAGSTKFAGGTSDNIIEISVTDTDPQLAAKLANAYMDALQKTNTSLALSEAAQRRAFYGAQMNDEKAALETADADLKRTQENSGFVAPSTQTALQLQGVSALREAIQQRQVQLAGLLKGATDQDPTVVRLRGELSSLRGELATMERGQSGGAGPSTAQVPEAALNYLRAQREVTFHETLFNVLSKQYEAARLDEERESPMVQVLDTAVVPDVKSGPRRSLIAICGGLLGLLGATLWQLFLAIRKNVRLTA